jgi:cytochrome c5
VTSRLPGISGAFALLCASVAQGAEPAALVQKACVSCHTLEVVAKKKATKDEWRETVKAMVDKGAPLQSEEVDTVVEYLSAKYAKLSAQEIRKREARGKELVESVCVLCHEFARISTEALTRDQWAGEIRGMLAEGAPLTDEEFEIVVDYLTKTYGVKDDK